MKKLLIAVLIVFIIYCFVLSYSDTQLNTKEQELMERIKDLENDLRWEKWHHERDNINNERKITNYIGISKRDDKVIKMLEDKIEELENTRD